MSARPPEPVRPAAPPFLSGRVRAIWDSLAAPVRGPVTTSDLPGAVGRWLDRVAPVDGADHRVSLLRMHGEIRLGSWRPFRADQVIGPEGFLWAAEAGGRAMRVRGHDLYADGSGEMDWRLFGLVPVMRRSGADVTRSAAGRFAGEMLVLSPFLARSGAVSWTDGPEGAAVATVTTGRWTHHVTLRFDSDDRLIELELPRWGEPDGAGFREATFGVVFDGERRFGGVGLPSSFTAGWRTDDGDDSFFRCTIDGASFR